MTENIASLIKKKITKSLTYEEELSLNKWKNSHPDYKEFLEKVVEEDILLQDASSWTELDRADEEELETNLERRIFKKISSLNSIKTKKSTSVLLKIIPYAAAVCLIVGVIGLFYVETQDLKKSDLETVLDVTAGGNRANLRLDDEHTIELNSNKNGIVIGNELTYDDGTKVFLDNSQTVSTAILTTPKGGKYQIVLSDGTRVWLNAASSLTYPSKFSANQREVVLNGEAYFEVAKVYRKDKDGESVLEYLPFVVKTSNQVIEVLGTEFNVMAYSDELTTNTTLIEGSVLLKTPSSSLLLQPGEQGVENNRSISKRKVNVNQFTSWKDNKFIFHETELQAAMNQLSRWYDLDVVYEGDISEIHFYGEISREKSLSEVLKILEIGGMNFRIEKQGNKNRVYVSR